MLLFLRIKLKKKESTYSHHYFMPKHFRFVRIIYSWAQTKLKNVEPKEGKKGFVRVMSRWREALFLIRG